MVLPGAVERGQPLFRGPRLVLEREEPAGTQPSPVALPDKRMSLGSGVGPCVSDPQGTWVTDVS